MIYRLSIYFYRCSRTCVYLACALVWAGWARCDVKWQSSVRHCLCVADSHLLGKLCQAPNVASFQSPSESCGSPLLSTAKIELSWPLSTIPWHHFFKVRDCPKCPGSCRKGDWLLPRCAIFPTVNLLLPVKTAMRPSTNAYRGWLATPGLAYSNKPQPTAPRCA